VTVARIELHGPTRTQHVTVRLGDGLALAVVQGAPIRVASTPGYDPRNLAFAEGLDGWDLNGSFFRDSTGSHWDDYYARATEAHGAALGAAVPEPYGFAALEQTIFADNYRGQTVSFYGELRTDGIQDRACAYLRIVVDGAVGGPAQAPSSNKQVLTRVGDSQDWARHEATEQIPDDAVFVQFGIALAGQGRIELRNAGLVSERAT